MRTFLASAACCFLALGAVSPSLSGPAIDFNRDVRPILSRHCFKCHGPDDQARTAGLRLDRREAAVKPGLTGRRAVAPGRPEQSELVRRIFFATPAGRMPPEQANLPLSDAQKETLKAWIAAGAEYQPHWAFVAPKRPPVPAVSRAWKSGRVEERQSRGAGPAASAPSLLPSSTLPSSPREWVRNPIDAFVLARLEAAGLKPSPEADRYTLARRVGLDLIGIPPTPEEADAFVNDASPDAYERLVDRLLSSPHYGERWARRWLDLARYADTNGYEKDRPRSIWPYRDWVIQALNADMPFDSFTIQQLAGDMLAEEWKSGRVEERKRPKGSSDSSTLPLFHSPAQDALVATGFHRNTMLNEEGGIDPLEFRFHAMTDRVSTTATTWLGLTVGCAQCHTHKFDPITQREYYQFMAFLNNADEPEIDLPDPKIAAQRQETEAKIAVLEAELPDRFPPQGELGPRANLERKFDDWLAQASVGAVHWTVLRPVEAKANLPLLTVLDDASVLASGDQSKRDVYTLSFRTDLKGITALRIEALPDERLPKHGPGRVYYEGPHGDFFLSEITLSGGGQAARLGEAAQTFASGNNSAAAAIDGDPQTGWSINGGQGQPHAAVFQLAEPLADTSDLTLTLLFERYHAAGLGRFRVSAATARNAAATALPPDVEALLLIPAVERQPEQRERLLRYYLQVAPELAEARQAIRKLRDALPAFPTTLVMAERPLEHPRPTYLHRRGEFLRAAEPLEPGVPAFLPPLPEGAPRNRLTFARWLVDSGNPLVGRVTVNRQWAAFFGRGIVPTLEDFGYQGQPPSHPELLDWLAVAFMSGRMGERENGSSGFSSPTPPLRPAPGPSSPCTA